MTIFEYERGVRFRRGRFNRVLDPGQEVLSADGVAVKASLAATYRVADAQRAVNKASPPRSVTAPSQTDRRHIPRKSSKPFRHPLCTMHHAPCTMHHAPCTLKGVLP